MSSSESLGLERQIVWQALDEPGMEHLHLCEDAERVVADGALVGVVDGQPLRLHYRVQCDVGYRFQTCRLRLTQPWTRELALTREPDGTWVEQGVGPLPALAGSHEIDISASPWTNTLPIRRLALQADQPAQIVVAYITIPELSVRQDRQRYTRLRTLDDRHIYRFESLASGFTADIAVDQDGLVLDYPGLFRRVWSR